MDSLNICREICTRTCKEILKIYGDFLKNGQNKESSLCNREMPHVCDLFFATLHFLYLEKLKLVILQVQNNQ